MTIRFALFLGLATALLTGAWAQSDAVSVRKQGEPIMFKAARLQAFNHLLPLFLTKDQLKELLPLIEEARKEDRELALKEIQTMRQMEREIDEALKKAEEGSVPTQELMADFQKRINAIGLTRQLLYGKHETLILQFVNAKLTAAQRRAAANSLTVTIKGEAERPSEEELLKVWIGIALLEPAAYEALLAIYKRA